MPHTDRESLTFKTRLQRASKDASCDLCDFPIWEGKQYIRILWSDAIVERMHLGCFREEFGDDG